MRPAIRVDGLSKSYQLGQRRESRYRTLRESLTGAAAGSWAKLKRACAGLLAKEPPKASSGRAEFWALRDTSFEVQPGEVIGVIGRNGAGKSTLLKILSRITEPTSGRAEVRGRIGSLLEVGTGFHPELTGRENIYLNGSILGMSHREIARKFDEIVAFAEIETFLDTPVKRYSSGMYTRLAFAVAAHLEPEILVVDEVLAVGDLQFQKKCLGKMQEVGSKGRTVLFVSHNMQAVQRLCNRLLLLDRGELVADGHSTVVMRQYMASGLCSSSYREWQPGDSGNTHPNVFLRKARVIDEAGESLAVVDILKPFFIEVEYWSDLTEIRPTAILQLRNEAGVCLFSTHEVNGPNWRSKPLKPGVTLARCCVPANFMAEGTFYVFVAVASFNPNVGYAGEYDALSFQVVDRSEGQGVRGEFVGDLCGVMRPMLDWTTRHVGSSVP